jgi:hypothetical protein
MRLRSSLHIMLLVLCALMITVAGRAGERPKAPDQIAIISSTDVWSETAACG